MIIVVFLILVLCGIIWAYMHERKEWNGGYCRKHKKKWRHFDNDSQGGRGYTDGKCYIWISYPNLERLGE